MLQPEFSELYTREQRRECIRQLLQIFACFNINNQTVEPAKPDQVPQTIEDAVKRFCKNNPETVLKWLQNNVEIQSALRSALGALKDYTEIRPGSVDYYKILDHAIKAYKHFRTFLDIKLSHM